MKKLARKLGEGIHTAAARSSKSRGDSKNSANQKRNISQKRNKIVNSTSGSKKKPRQQTKTKRRPSTYVGIDLHKKTLQVEVQDSKGNVLSNKKIRNTAMSIRREFACIPRDARCVIESSSVWYEVFRFIRDDLGYEMILSNPAQTKAIAASKKKTDKVDAHILADLLRGGYIAVSHVPDKKIIESRQMVRYRHDKVEQRTQCKNVIHGILLQDAITIPGSTFSNAYTRALHGLNDYRIEGNLKIIDSINDVLYKINAQIHAAVDASKEAQLPQTIPGVGEYTALVLSSAIDNVERFPDSASLVSYFGLAPSVRNSADVTHHGRITKKGDKLVRHVLVEAVHTHVRYAPHSKLSQFHQRVKAKRGTSKAAVATASKMLRIIYQMLKNGSEFQP